ncbi:Aldo/keto reductase [Niveomyces insectorum RCEF 264]|uniref:Aldo/keto reductase n=1 Tax=Niveomyces insectorum RCEF 264 TaxID=1081102 RepID=A0A167QFP5_9HYPO|nr:Aldo/keto reductase [Niveomyces insectorum RCEF 264]
MSTTSRRTADPIAFSKSLPRLVLGGAGFSNQTHPDPDSVPVASIVRQAFDQGLRAVDTAPFYEPSEKLLGQALADPEIADRYVRSDYVLMTKVGRTGPATYDYTPASVQESVRRSLAFLKTDYLDVVFCHDIEAVTDEDVVAAVGVLLALVDEGIVRFIGLSSYRLDLLTRRANLVRATYGRPVDVVQTWGHLTLQNTQLETAPEGLAALKAAGVAHVFSSSPLAIGLLRKEGVPLGRKGDFHPAPAGLRAAARDLADYMESQGENLATLALRYSLWRAHVASIDQKIGVSTLTGIASLADLTENVDALRKILLLPEGHLRDASINAEQLERDKALFEKARTILGEWVDWAFTCPEEGWDPVLKRVVK